LKCLIALTGHLFPTMLTNNINYGLLILLKKKIFPCLVNRSKIVKIEKEIKDPIDCAIDLITHRVELLQNELNKLESDTKTLQIVLQGSIMLQVNAGPLAIVNYFLSRKDQFPKEKVDILMTKLNQFAKSLHFAVMLNNKLIDPSQVEYQKAIIEAYNVFSQGALKIGIQTKIFTGKLLNDE